MTALPGLRGIFWALVIAGWAAALTAGAVWIHRHPRPDATESAPATGAGCLSAAAKRQKPGFTVKRAMALNHLIRQQDADWGGASGGAQQSAVLGRYSRCPIAAGQRLIQEETVDKPTVNAPTGRVSHPFPLDGHSRTAGVINAGTVLDMFDGTRVVARGVPVLALECPSGSTDGCKAFLALAADDVPRLHVADPKTVLLVMTKP